MCRHGHARVDTHVATQFYTHVDTLGHKAQHLLGVRTSKWKTLRASLGGYTHAMPALTHALMHVCVRTRTHKRMRTAD